MGSDAQLAKVGQSDLVFVCTSVGLCLQNYKSLAFSGYDFRHRGLQTHIQTDMV